MKIKFDEVTLTLSHEEIWDIQYAMKKLLTESITGHYKTLMHIQTFSEFERVIKSQEKLKLSLLRSISNMLDCPEFYEEVIELIGRTWAEMEIKKAQQDFSSVGKTALPEKDK